MPARKAAGSKVDQRPAHQPAVVELVVHEGELPAPPDELGAEAGQLWTRFLQSRVAGAVDFDSDLPALYRWVRAWDRYFELERVMRHETFEHVVSGSKEQPILNPLYKALEMAEQSIERAEAKFGMTPRDRAQLGLDLAAGQLTAERLNAQIARQREERRQVGSGKARRRVKGFERA